ncbi:MAG: hypothetical protein HQL02_02900 [Nitrospirae bacterium]|nr:hypothetical protein [Nitrospirota bacterium]
MFEDMPVIYDSFQIDARLVVTKDDTLNACQRLPDNTFSLIVSSPPYNIGKDYEKELPLQEYIEWQETIISQLVRIMNKTGCLCWQVGNYIYNREVFPLDMYFYPIFKRNIHK